MAPESMIAEKRWVNWKYETRSGEKPTKVPYQPNGQHAKTNDPATWSDHAMLSAGQFAGFVLGDGWFGVDLDDSRGTDWERDVIAHFPGAYIEVSPSGRGVKLFCHGVDPVKGRKKAMGGGAIEVYGAGRYFAVTGETVQEGVPGDCSEGLAWLLETHFAEPAKAVDEQPRPATVKLPASIEDRVTKYLNKVPGAVSGLGGHNHTFHVAGQLVHGFDLTVDAALPPFQQWNTAKCQPPWSDKDLERKLREVEKALCDKPRGWLLNESNDWSEAASGVDLSKLSQKPVEQTAERLPVEVYDKLPGVLKEIFEYNIATSMYPQEEIALAGALALVSVLTGRKVKDSYKTRSNLYVVAIAESGAGKDRSRDLNRQILIEANCSILEGPEQMASDAGVVSTLDEHPARLLQIDEIGDLFQSIRGAGAKAPWLSKILQVIKTLYTSSGKSFLAGGYKSVEANKSIDQPSLTIFGSSGDDFWEGISYKLVRDGTMGRIMVFGPMKAKTYKGRPPELPIPASIINYAKAWSGWTPGGLLASERPEPLTLQHTPEAYARVEKHLTEISERAINETGPKRAIWRRAGEKTNKIALVLASSRWKLPPAAPVEITIQDVDLAIQISNWTSRRCIEEVLEKVYESDREKWVKKILRMCQKPKTKTEIVRATQGLSSRMRDEIMQELIGVLAVSKQEEKTKGPIRTVFLTIGGQA